MKWLFKDTFSWFDLIAISIISAAMGVYGWWALLLDFPSAVAAIIGKYVTETRGEIK